MTTRASMIITESGLSRVTGGFRNAERQVDRFGRTGQRAGQRVSRAMSATRGSIGLLTRAAAGLGLAFGARAVLGFNQQLGQLQSKAKLTTEQAKKLRHEILQHNKVATIGKEKYLEAANAFQDLGGRLKEGRQLMRFLGETSLGTGAEIKDLAELSANLINVLGQSPDEVRQTIADLNAQADQGSVAIKDLARVMGELAATEQDVKAVGLAMQTVGTVTQGNAERAKFALLALMRELEKNQGKLKKQGIDVWETDASGRRKLRDVNRVMAEVISKTGGDPIALGKIFSAEAMRAVRAYRGQMTMSGDARAGSTYAMVSGATNQDTAALLRRQYETALGGIDAAGQKLRGTLAELEEKLQDFGSWIANTIAANPRTALAAGVGTYAAYRLLPGLIGRMFGRGKGGGVAGQLMGAAGGRGLPVYVTNFPGSPSGATGSMPAIKRGTGWLPTMGKTVAGYGGKAALLAGGAMLAGGVGGGIAGIEIGRRHGLAIQQQAGAQRASAHGQSIAAQELVRQAGQLAAMGKSGVGQFQTAPGGPMAQLTQANVLAALKSKAEQQGISADVMAKLIPVLQQLTEGLKNQPPIVVASPGVDSPKVQRGRQVSR